MKLGLLFLGLELFLYFDFFLLIPGCRFHIFNVFWWVLRCLGLLLVDFGVLLVLVSDVCPNLSFVVWVYTHFTFYLLFSLESTSSVYFSTPTSAFQFFSLGCRWRWNEVASVLLLPTQSLLNCLWVPANNLWSVMFSLSLQNCRVFYVLLFFFLQSVKLLLQVLMILKYFRIYCLPSLSNFLSHIVVLHSWAVLKDVSVVVLYSMLGASTSLLSFLLSLRFFNIFLQFFWLFLFLYPYFCHSWLAYSSLHFLVVLRIFLSLSYCSGCLI